MQNRTNFSALIVIRMTIINFIHPLYFNLSHYMHADDKEKYMFKGREKELYITPSLPSYYIFANQKKNMISFFGLLKLYVVTPK